MCVAKIFGINWGTESLIIFLSSQLHVKDGDLVNLKTELAALDHEIQVGLLTFRLMLVQTMNI